MADLKQNKYYFLASGLAAIAALALWNHDGTINIVDEDDEDHEEFVALTLEQQHAAGIQTETAKQGYLQNTLRTHGKIVLDGNHVAHVIPKVSGNVRVVHKNEGESVVEGEPLAVLESREMAEAKSAYLSALKKERIVSQLLMMEQQLYDKQISSNQDFQNALKESESLTTELELTRQKLYVLGLNEQEIDGLENHKSSQLRDYTINSPLTGTLLFRHATLGEQLTPDKEAFIVANLNHLWVEVQITPQDQPQVKKGAKAKVQAIDGRETFAEIVYINPVIDEETRKAKAIAVLDNQEGAWNPGSYVSIEINTDKKYAPLVVSKEAVQNIEGTNCVFIEAENGFEIRPVETGKCDGKKTEILSGINKGEKVAYKNTFLLKADHLKNEAEHEH